MSKKVSDSSNEWFHKWNLSNAVYISKLIRYVKDCASYHYSLDRCLVLKRKLQNVSMSDSTSTTIGGGTFRWLLFYLFYSSIVINAVIVTAGTFEP
jgi:hypothetical protein